MKYEQISIEKLEFDLENFRIPEQHSQRQALTSLIADQNNKGGGNGIVNLARDIAENGINPADLMVVVPRKGSTNYRVVEGNRRLAALQLLNNAELAKTVGVDKGIAAKRSEYSRIDTCYCVVFDRKTDARVWIDRKHKGELKGAGTVAWNAVQQARADGTREVAILEYVSENASSADVKAAVSGYDFPITTLKRAGAALREKLGLSYEAGEVHFADQKNYTVLEAFLVALGTKQVDVNTLFTRDDINKYLDGLIRNSEDAGREPREPPIDPNGQGGDPDGERKREEKKSKPARSGRGGKRVDDTATRRRLIPRTCYLPIPDGRIADIYKELRTSLDVVKHRNSAAVLTRVFVELSLDKFIKHHSINLPQDKKGRIHERLSDKLRAVMRHLETQGFMSRNQLKPIRTAVSNLDSFGSTETLNAYVHHTSFNPDPLQLKLTWNNYQEFMQTVWNHM